MKADKFVPLTKESLENPNITIQGESYIGVGRAIDTALRYLERAETAEARVAELEDFGRGELDRLYEAEERAVQLETKVSTLTAAIATPEVYAGVVTEALEIDRASWVKRVRELEAEVVGLKACMRNALDKLGKNYVYDDPQTMTSKMALAKDCLEIPLAYAARKADEEAKGGDDAKTK